MTTVLANRHRNLQIIRALWSGGDVKTAVDSAVSMQVVFKRSFCLKKKIRNSYLSQSLHWFFMTGWIFCYLSMLWNFYSTFILLKNENLWSCLIRTHHCTFVCVSFCVFLYGCRSVSPSFSDCLFFSVLCHSICLFKCGGEGGVWLGGRSTALATGGPINCIFR